MTKKEQQSAERQQAIDKLRETLKPGDTVYTVLRHVSRSGMQREISLKIAGTGGEIEDITYTAATAMNDRIGKRGGIIAGGCGMDMGFALVYNLGYALWPTGYGCVGEKCRSNDHSNGDRDRTPHTCNADNSASGNEYWNTHKHSGARDALPPRGKYGVCHWHTDGGYALQHRWL